MANQQITLLPGIGDLLSRTWQIYKERIWVFLGIMILPLIFLFFGVLFVLQIKAFQLELIWMVAFSVLVLISFIIIFWSRVALLFAIKERGEKIGIRESFSRGWPKILSYFWISILVGFVTIIGFLLFIIPGIIFSVWLSFATYVLIAEGLTGTKALSPAQLRRAWLRHVSRFHKHLWWLSCRRRRVLRLNPLLRGW